MPYFLLPTLSFYLDWSWWLLMFIVLASVYVQGVGFNLEQQSGIARIAFGKMYAFPAAVRPFCWLAMLLFSGWVSVLASIASMFVASFLFARIAKEHARIIIQQAEDQAAENE